MTLGHDELTRPLGMEKPVARRSRVPALPWPQLLVGALVAVLAGLVAFVVMMPDPDGGEPFAIVTLEKIAPPLPVEAPAKPASPPAGPEASGEVREDPSSKPRNTAGELEQMSGVKVVRQGTASAPDAIVIKVPQSGDAKLPLPPAPDKRLVERSRHGLLPKVGADGARPADVYARPVPPFPGGKPAGRIALVVGGLGLSQSVTSDAITLLPGAVTLAFPPYGTDLERQAARAREVGHELLLQVPMEPYDYPDNDPGPHTLTATAPSAETLDKLAWVMSRFPGYVGVMNAMGGRFTASETALNPVMSDLAARGLVYVDDGTSARSVALSVAPLFKLPATRADAIVDLSPRGAAIDEQLARLEATARDKGVAVGTASAVPVSIERIAAWAKTLEGKGLQLVPVSAVLAQPAR